MLIPWSKSSAAATGTQPLVMRIEWNQAQGLGGYGIIGGDELQRRRSYWLEVKLAGVRHLKWP